MEVTTTIGMILHRKGGDIWSVSPDDTVYTAVARMAEHNIGALPVIKDTQLVGMFSERDYARKIVLQGKLSRETPVGDIMTTQVITVSPKDSVQDCLEHMTTKRIRHLPVMEEGKPVGIISIGDLVNWMINAQRVRIADLEKYVMGAEPV